MRRPRAPPSAPRARSGRRPPPARGSSGRAHTSRRSGGRAPPNDTAGRPSTETGDAELLLYPARVADVLQERSCLSSVRRPEGVAFRKEENNDDSDGSLQ